jgi:hypothetical protein
MSVQVRGRNVSMESRGPNNLIFVKEVLGKDVTVKTQGRRFAPNKFMELQSMFKLIRRRDRKTGDPCVGHRRRGFPGRRGSPYIGSNGGATSKVGPCQPSDVLSVSESSHGHSAACKPTERVMPSKQKKTTGSNVPSGRVGRCEWKL